MSCHTLLKICCNPVGLLLFVLLLVGCGQGETVESSPPPATEAGSQEVIEEGANEGTATAPAEVVMEVTRVREATATAPSSPESGEGGESGEETPGAAAGTIAYVEGSAQDEIRLVAPDGSGDRLLWRHGVDDPPLSGYPEGLANLGSLSWRPDGSELAFRGTHERWCSLNSADIYVISSSGDEFRRLTQGPSCAELAEYPTGSVQVPLENPFGSQYEGLIYFQGAAEAQAFSVAPNGSAVVSFERVADLGQGVMQRAILINVADGEDRDYGEETAVDVQSGEVVETTSISLEFPNLSLRQARSPTWRYDGSRVGYVFNYSSLYAIDPRPAPLQQGELLVTGGYLPGLLDYADHLAWGPTAERAGELLYRGEEMLESGIYLVMEGSEEAGEPLVTFDPIREEVRGLAWLPDGSGFLYSLSSPSGSAVADHANIYHYRFASGEVSALTAFEAGDWAGRLTISPDGEQVVFERGTGASFLTGELMEPDLWIMNVDGSDLQLLVEDGRSPAWRPDGESALSEVGTR